MPYISVVVSSCGVTQLHMHNVHLFKRIRLLWNRRVYIESSSTLCIIHHTMTVQAMRYVLDPHIQRPGCDATPRYYLNHWWLITHFGPSFQPRTRLTIGPHNVHSMMHLLFCVSWDGVNDLCIVKYICIYIYMCVYIWLLWNRLQLNGWVAVSCCIECMHRQSEGTSRASISTHTQAHTHAHIQAHTHDVSETCHVLLEVEL